MTSDLDTELPGASDAPHEDHGLNPGSSSDGSEINSPSTIGRRIRSASLRIGGQKKLADALGVTEQRLSNWTRGKGAPSPEFLARIVKATRCDAHWLLTGEGSAWPTRPSSLQAGADSTTDQEVTGRIPPSELTSKKNSSEGSGDALGDRIRALSKEFGGQKKLAEAIGASQNMVSAWVTGSKVPSTAYVAAIVAATGCDAAWLLTGQTPPKAHEDEVLVAMAEATQILTTIRYSATHRKLTREERQALARASSLLSHYLIDTTSPRRPPPE